MPRRKTHEEFVLDLSEKNPYVIPLGSYVNNSTKIEFKCKICDRVYAARPADALRGKGCRICGLKRGSEKQRKTHEEFMMELFNINPNVTLMGKYTGAFQKINVRCNLCGNIWDSAASNLLYAKGCPKCSMKLVASKIRKSPKQFEEEMNALHPELIFIDEYFDSSTKLLYVCTVCGETQYGSPPHLLSGEGCRFCGRQKCYDANRKTHDEFIQEMEQVNPQIEILTNYTTNKTKVRARCKICFHEWYPVAASLSAGYGCPMCCLSKGEKGIDQFLHSNSIEHSHQQTYKTLRGVGNGLLSYDFYVPDYNVLIEYQGQYHDGTARNQTEDDYAIQQEHDRRKTEYAKENNITLLEIWYYEFEDIEKILTEKLLQSPLTITALMGDRRAHGRHLSEVKV